MRAFRYRRHVVVATLTATATAVLIGCQQLISMPGTAAVVVVDNSLSFPALEAHKATLFSAASMSMPAAVPSGDDEELAQPTPEPVAESTPEEMSAPVAQPTDEPAAQPTDEQVASVAQPLAEQVAPVDQPLAEPVAPVAQPTAEPVPQPTAAPETKVDSPSQAEPEQKAASVENKPLLYETGIASTYGQGDGFEGMRTGCGSIFHTHEVQVAHKTLPCGTVVRIEDTSTGKTVDAEVTDRGPYVPGRIVDLSYAAFTQLDPSGTGLLHVNVYILDTSHQYVYRLR
jgi:rare lipoprotein A (peptidoglycan hydrolase)